MQVGRLGSPPAHFVPVPPEEFNTGDDVAGYRRGGNHFPR
jgi:hypothetical protein